VCEQTQAFPLKFIFPVAVPIIHLLMNEIIAKHKVIQRRIGKSVSLKQMQWLPTIVTISDQE
jgi:hypothetical protein